MTKTVVGLFHDPEEAAAALHDLHHGGFSRDDLSLVARRSASEAETELANVEHAGKVGAGAALGGVTGLLLGLAALALPGIGPIVAAGPVAAALAGAGVGAAAGGLLGALSELGIPENEAGYFAEGLRRGGTVLAVRAPTQEHAEKAQAVLDRHGAVDVEERADTWRQRGWSQFDPAAGPLVDAAETRARTESRTSRAARIYERDMQISRQGDAQ